MTVSVQQTYNLAVGNGVTTVFPYQFKILSSSDLQVYVAGVLKTLNVDYSVAGVGADVGGSVTFLLGAPANLATVSIMRAMTVRRTTDYQQLGDFLTPVVNPDFDNAILLIQDLTTQLGRSIRTPADEVGTLPTLPSIANRAGKYGAYDALGLPIASSGTGNDSALRTDLAITTAGVDGSRLVGYRRTEAGSVARSVFTRLTEMIFGKDFGALFDNATNDGAAFDSALTAAFATVAGAQGNAIELPQGTSILSASKNIPNRVSLRGRNKRGTVLKASAGHAGPQMFTVDNGVSSMFDNSLRDLTIDCNDVAGLSAVLSDAWQEGGGIRDVLVYRFRNYGIRFQIGDGGAALCRIADSEFFGSTSNCVAGILADLSVSAAFMLFVQNSTFAGAGPLTSTMPKGIQLVGASSQLINVHFEMCVSGVYLDGAGNHVLIGLTGGSATALVDNLVEIAATFTGTVTLIGCFRNGSTNFLKDNRAGGYGTITGVDPPFMTIAPVGTVPDWTVGKIWGECHFDGTPAGPALTALKAINITAITKNGVGDYTVQCTRSVQTAADLHPWGSSNSANGIVRCDQNGAGSVRVRHYVAGALADPNEIHVFINRAV